MASVLDQIDTYQPKRSWRGIAALIARILEVKPPAKRIQAILRLLERFPDEDGNGALLGLRHELESLPGYEKALVASVRRTPGLVTSWAVQALVNAGVRRVGTTDLAALLTERRASARSADSSTSFQGDDLLRMFGDVDVAKKLAKAVGEQPKRLDEEWVVFPKAGFAVAFGPRGRLDNVAMPPGTSDNERRGTMSLPLGLAFTMSRTAVRKLLGKPKRVTAYKAGIPYLGGSAAQDAFETEALTLLVTYVPDLSRVTRFEATRR